MRGSIDFLASQKPVVLESKEGQGRGDLYSHREPRA